MALRYKFNGAIPSPVADDDLVRPKVMRAPQTVQFRSGADLDKLAKGLGEAQSLMLDAAVGSGKSTLFPKALALVTKALVIHVVPNALLALDLYTYVVKQSEARSDLTVPLERWMDQDQQVPRTGVLYMSSADLILLVARRGSLSQYPKVTVFLDEAHESDACTYLIRTLGLNLGMARLVQSSATFGPSGFRPRETLGTMECKTFDKGLVPKDWKIDDPSSPWNFGKITNNLLVIVDSRSDAALLKRAYEDVGMLAYRIEANMPEQEFQTAMRALRDKKGPLVVLLGDYSCRSGFSLDVNLILDTGSVSYFDPTPGVVRKLSRPMCQFESVQGAGRGGRVRAGKCHYYCPDAEFPAQICDIEGVEREAAAYLSRCLGYKPVGVLASTIMSKEDLPQGVVPSTAINGVYPLTYYVIDSAGKPRSRSSSPSGDRKSMDSDESYVSTQSRDIPTPPPKYVDDIDYQEFVASLDQGSVMPPPGEFLKVGGVSVKEKPTVIFPSGLRSVRALVGSVDGNHNVRGLTREDRKFAISLVVNRYNLLNVEATAMDQTLRWVAKGGCKAIATVRVRVMELFEERGRVVAERDELHDCLEALTFRMFDVRSIAPLENLVNQRVDSHRKVFEDDDSSDGDDEYGRSLAKLSSHSSRGHNAIDYNHQERKSRHRRSSKSYDNDDCKETVGVLVPSRLPFVKDRMIKVSREEKPGQVVWRIRK